MKIIIVGVGKVGYAIAEQMTGENHDIVIVDQSSAVLDHADSMLDVMCVEGNGASASVLLEAGVREADLLIAVSENDEVNLICCLMAKKLGAKHTVARVRNPEYFRDASILRREIGLDMIINPEHAAAQEVSRILRVPSAFSVETFARGLVELIGFQTEANDTLVGKSLIDFNRENPNSILMCAAKRGDEVIVPNGSFVPQAGDRVYVIGTPAETTRVLRSMGRAMSPIRRVSILGGGRDHHPRSRHRPRPARIRGDLPLRCVHRRDRPRRGESPYGAHGQALRREEGRAQDVAHGLSRHCESHGTRHGDLP